MKAMVKSVLNECDFDDDQLYTLAEHVGSDYISFIWSHSVMRLHSEPENDYVDLEGDYGETVAQILRAFVRCGKFDAAVEFVHELPLPVRRTQFYFMTETLTRCCTTHEQIEFVNEHFINKMPVQPAQDNVYYMTDEHVLFL